MFSNTVSYVYTEIINKENVNKTLRRDKRNTTRLVHEINMINATKKSVKLLQLKYLELECKFQLNKI